MNLLREACRISSLAYGRPEGAVVCKVRTAKAIIIENQGRVWISIEGTRQKFLDWLKNFFTVSTDWYGLQAHGGCAIEAKLLFQMITSEIRKRGSRQVYITGHSQGGGVASLVAWALETQQNIQVVEGYGIAPMRSMLKASVATFNCRFANRWWRVARQSDVVPHLPPALRYGSVGKDIFFDEKGRMQEKIPGPFAYLFEAGKLIVQKNWKQMWADHDIQKYMFDASRIANN